MSRSSALCACVLLAAVLCQARPARADDPPLALVGEIELPGIAGRLDHLALDAAHDRLFVAALGAGRVEAIDLHLSRRVSSLAGLREPQGLAWDAREQRLLVAEGGRVDAFTADGERVARAGGLDDADNLHLDAASGLLYVAADDALAVLDAKSLRLERRFALEGHPEAFALSAEGPEIYVNVPSAGRVAVLDRRSGRTLRAFELGGAGGNFALALDEPRRRLYVATRRPARLVVFDTASGARVAGMPLCGDADDLFLDAERQRLYAICGDGSVDVVRQLDADHVAPAQRLATAPGARTGLFVPERATLFVAVPARDGRPAALRAYRVR